ncbi:MAG: hypothetical protein ACOC46_00880, partial [Pirellulales bacterium]
MNDEVRQRVEARIAAHYAGLRVSVRSAELLHDRGIRVQGLSIVEPGAEGPHAELLHLDELMLFCDTDLQSLMQGQLDVDRIRVERPVLRVTRRPDGSYSAAKLLPLPRLSAHPPELQVAGGTIELFDPLRVPSSTLTLRDVNLTIRPSRNGQRGETADGNPGQNAAPRAGASRLEGTLGGDHFRRVAVEGWVDPHSAFWDLGGMVEGLSVSPALFDALPNPLADHLRRLGGLRGQARINFRLAHDASSRKPPQFAVSGELSHGRIDDPRLPYPLTELRTAFRGSNEGFAIDRLSARWNEATVRMSCRHDGYRADGPLTLTAELRRLKLSRELLRVLPEPLQRQWQIYRPAGQVDADVELHFDGRRWRPRASVRCLDVSFTHEEFPYRLDHGTGRVELGPDRLRVSLSASSENRPVRVTAEVDNPLGRPHGWLQVRGDEIALDEKLLVALPDRAGEVVRSLKPEGLVAAAYRVWKEAPDAALHKRLRIQLKGCSIRYAKFPYPLEGVTGRIEMRDGQWWFRNLEGYNDTGRVTCRGQLQPATDGHRMTLVLQAWNVPLEQELREALKPTHQRLWEEVRPRGAVDLTAEVDYLSAGRRLNVTTHIWPQPETASIEPVRFPYRLEKLAGELVFCDGKLSFDRLKAEHGAVRLGSAGDCRLLPDGRWQLRLHDLSVDRLRFDRELVHALPGRLKKVVTGLNPSGPFYLRGTIDLTSGPLADSPVTCGWDVNVGCHQGTLDCGLKLENVHGGVSLVGGFDGRRVHTRGELDVDSLTYKDYQFTQLMGPVWITEQQVLLGSWVDRGRGGGHDLRAAGASGGGSGVHDGRRPRSLTAKLFGGTIYGDGWVDLGPVPRWGLHATLNRAKLSRLAQEVIAGRQHLGGKINATVDLRGAGSSRNALVGHGAVRLHEADLFDLPLMVALLKLLSVRRPDLNAFTRSDI